MKSLFKMVAALVLLNLAVTDSFAQTSGTLTFSFTEVSKPANSTYSNSGKHVLAVWIETNTGTFVKTKIRYAGGGTSDHLPTWATNSGGSSFNCLSSSCNVVSATTGATRTSFATRTITWDGTDVSGNIVPDGTYQVLIQETWNHSGSGTALRSLNFVKGPNSDIQTPVSDANFSSLSLDWSPTLGIDESSSNSDVVVYPNPSADGIFSVDYSSATSMNVLNVQGVEVYSEKLTNTSGTHKIDLSSFSNGIYFIQVIDEENSTKQQVSIEKK